MKSTRFWGFMILIVIFFFSGIAIADEVQPVSKPQASAGAQKQDQASSLLEKIGFQSRDAHSGFLLQFDKRACLMKCDSQFESCMSGAGDSASEKFRCGEKRWACTRNCDSKTNKPHQF